MNKPHAITFVKEVDPVAVPPNGKAYGVHFGIGEWVEVILHPHVIEKDDKLVEVADLELPGGDVIPDVSYSSFTFENFPN